MRTKIWKQSHSFKHLVLSATINNHQINQGIKLFFSCHKLNQNKTVEENCNVDGRLKFFQPLYSLIISGRSEKILLSLTKFMPFCSCMSSKYPFCAHKVQAERFLAALCVKCCVYSHNFVMGVLMLKSGWTALISLWLHGWGAAGRGCWNSCKHGSIF